MRAVFLHIHAELGEQRQRVLRHVMAVAVIDVDAVLGDLDAEVPVAHLARDRGDFVRRLREGPPRVHGQKPVGVVLRQIAFGPARIHDAASEIMFLDRAARVRAHLHHEHVLDVQLRGNAEQNRGDAGRIGVGQLGEVAGAHQHLGIGTLAPHLGVALKRRHEAEIDGVEHGIDEIGPALGVERVHGAIERSHVAMLLRDEHRDGRDLIGDGEGRFVEAQKKIGAGLAAAPELVRVGGIDADLQARVLERLDRVFEMGKRRIGKAAEIDHVRPRIRVAACAREDRLDGKRGRIDDLGEDLDVIFAHVGGFPRAAEIDRDVLELVRSAQEGHAEALA